jgi:hypothetical protein
LTSELGNVWHATVLSVQGTAQERNSQVQQVMGRKEVAGNHI